MDLQDIGLKHILIIFFIALLVVGTLSCLNIFNDGKDEIREEETTIILDNIFNTNNNVSINNTNNSGKRVSKKINETIIITYLNVTRYLNVTKINQINITKEYKLNISFIQRDLILNLKPNVCHTIGCSDGFDKCKRETLDILEWKKPKFREAWSTGYKTLYQDDKEKDSFYKFIKLNDSFGSYISLNSSYWKVNHPFNYTILNNLTQYNITRFDNEEFEEFNLSQILLSLIDRENVIIRRV